jgi:hypothetical protein
LRIARSAEAGVRLWFQATSTRNAISTNCLGSFDYRRAFFILLDLKVSYCRWPTSPLIREDSGGQAAPRDVLASVFGS